MASQFLNTETLLLLVPVLLLAWGWLRYNRLRHIPGPLMPAVTDLWIQSKIWRGWHNPEILHELHRAYGPVVRWGPNRVSFASPAAIPKIYSTKEVLPKAPSYQPLVELAQGHEIFTLITIRNERRMSAIKHQIAAGFSQSTWLKQEDQIDQTLDLLLQRLHEAAAAAAAGGAPVRLSTWLSLWAFDTLAQLAFSDSRGYLHAGADVDGAFAGARARFAHWAAWQLLPTLEARLYKGWLARRMRRTSSALVRLAVARIEQRKRRGGAEGGDGARGGGRDLIGRFLAASQQNPLAIAPRDVLALTVSTIHAGAETTAFSSSHILANLLTHPESFAKLEQEILDAHLSFPPQFKEVASLPYLEAVIHESMRYTPLATSNLERTTTRDTIICRVPIPKGTDVCVCSAESSRDAAVYGADVDLFRPERWLEANDQQRTKMATAALAFSHGPRKCIGQHLARIEMKKLITALIMTFKLELVCLPVTRCESIINEVDLKVRLEPRN